MNRNELVAIVAIHKQLNSGISNPKLINAAYTTLPNAMSPVDEIPMRSKIIAINRFMMLSYADVLMQVVQDELSNKIQVNEASIGTIENKKKQSHNENSLDSENIDVMGFLTKAEKEQLKHDGSNTELIIEHEGQKRRSRKGIPNKKK